MQDAEKFRLNTSTFFLTYPQCEAPKEVLLDFLQAKIEVVEYVIAHELHENGDDHLHCYVRSSQKYNFKNSNCFDFVWNETNYHGNYQGARSPKNVIKYCTKEEDYIANIDVKAILDKTPKRALISKKLIKDKLSLESLVEENPELIYDYKKLKTNLEEYKLDQYKPVEREVECIWYWGATGNGKSRTAVNKLGGDYKDIYTKANTKWWDGYRGQKYVLLDELDGANWNINFIKRWADRYPCLLEFKGGTCWNMYEKFYITCQHDIDTFYQQANVKLADIDAIKRRFKQVHVTRL